MNFFESSILTFPYFLSSPPFTMAAAMFPPTKALTSLLPLLTPSELESLAVDDEMAPDTSDAFFALASRKAAGAAADDDAKRLLLQLLSTFKLSREFVRQTSEDLDDDDGVDEEMGEEEEVGVSKQCEFCAVEAFHTAVALREHVRRAHVLRCLWTCITCGAVFKGLEPYKQHLVKVLSLLWN